MTRPVFDLASEPWIPVLSMDGTPRELSLVEVFGKAHEIRWLDAEAPPVTAALHRLLLAVLHASLKGPRDWQAWHELWESDTLPSDAVQSYLDKDPEAFDLFDPQRPFLQCPSLASIKSSPAARLVHFRSSGNNRTLFDHTTIHNPVQLPPAEAARWLVTVQCYDPGGTKTPYTTKKSVASLGNKFGMVLVEGSTLKETLLLNAYQYDPDYGFPWDSVHDDRPAWEANPPNPEPEERDPHGWLDLLTWPSRRVLLHPLVEDSTPVVDGVVLTPGTSIRGDLHGRELMAAFERSETTKKQDQIWIPVRLHELHGIWRHARKLLLNESAQLHQRPMVLDHVADQVERDTVSRHAVFTIRVFDQQLDDNGRGSVYAWLQEHLPAPAALLRARQPWLGEVLGSAVALADGVGDALTTLNYNCRAAFRADPKDAKRDAKHNFGLTQSYWPKLPPEFAVLLRNLGRAIAGDADPKTPVAEWRRVVREAGEEVAGHLLAQLQERQAQHIDGFAQSYETFRRAVDKQCRTFDRKITRHMPEYGEP